jgi:hypothetical protein
VTDEEEIKENRLGWAHKCSASPVERTRRASVSSDINTVLETKNYTKSGHHKIARRSQGVVLSKTTASDL